LVGGRPKTDVADLPPSESHPRAHPGPEAPSEVAGRRTFCSSRYPPLRCVAADSRLLSPFAGLEDHEPRGEEGWCVGSPSFLLELGSVARGTAVQSEPAQSNTFQRLVSLPSGREHLVDGQLTSRPPPSFCCLPRSKLRPSSPPLAPALLASLSSLDARSSLQPSTSPTATTARAGPRARATRPGSSPRASSPASSRPASSGTSSATSVRGVFLTPSSLSVSRRDC
jgi:hypothetical protein